MARGGGGSRIGSGMTKGRREPRWVVAFLRALERTGKARWAAEDAGIDHTTAYARRRAHAAFAAAWAAALERRRAAKDVAREAELAETGARARKGAAPPLVPSPASPAKSSLPRARGEELIASGNRLKRASPERWSARKQKAYLAELAATGNHRCASKAAGISYEAVLKRRRADPDLEAACQAAIAACGARAPEFLASAMVATFDPQSLPDDGINPLPRITIDQAIRIAQLPGAGGKAAGPTATAVEAYDVADVARRLADKLDRLGEAALAEGWQRDESNGCLVPPGWARIARDGP